MIDFTVNKILYVAHLMERALHEPEGWSIQWGPYTVPATRVITDTGVRFDALFPEMCHLSPMPRNASLCFRGEVVAIRAMEHPGDCGFALSWALSAQTAGASV